MKSNQFTPRSWALVSVALLLCGTSVLAARRSFSRSASVGSRSASRTASGSHGSVRTSTSVQRTGYRSAEVTRSGSVSTAHGTKSVSRSADVHRTQPYPHVRYPPASVHKRAHVRHAVGHTVHVMPKGHTTWVIGGTKYYHHEGEYFVKLMVAGAMAYVVAKSPVMSVLPSGCTTIYVAGIPYYYYDDVYYVQQTDNGVVMYVVTEAPPTYGGVFYELPAHYAEVVISGRTYFTNGETYCIRAYQDNQIVYVVVEKP